MLETILIILLVSWAIGAIFFGYICFFSRVLEGRTIVESAYDNSVADVPVPENILAGLIRLIALFMVIGWPVTLFFVLTKKSNSQKGV